MTALLKSFTANRAAIDRATSYDRAKAACRSLSDYDRACLAAYLIDSLDDFHTDPIDGTVWDMRDLRHEAGQVIGDIVGRLEE